MVKELGTTAQYNKKRFGLIAIEKGFISDDELITALMLQVKKEIKEGRHKMIGEILLDMGVMSGKQVEEVLAEMSR
jgi:transcriptional regulator CtsR